MVDDLVVIADAGPLIGLAVIGQLPILPSLFGRVIVPSAVWNEVTTDSTAPGAPELLRARFIERVEPPAESARRFLDHLDRGEAQALALASIHSDALLLIDDLAARKLARQLHLRCTGTVGVLIEARRRGILPSLKPSLDGLVAHGIYLSDDLLRRALASVDEG